MQSPLLRERETKDGRREGIAALRSSCEKGQVLEKKFWVFFFYVFNFVVSNSKFFYIFFFCLFESLSETSSPPPHLPSYQQTYLFVLFIHLDKIPILPLQQQHQRRKKVLILCTLYGNFSSPFIVLETFLLFLDCLLSRLFCC